MPASNRRIKPQKKLSKVSPQDLIVVSLFLSIALGSQSAPRDLKTKIMFFIKTSRYLYNIYYIYILLFICSFIPPRPSAPNDKT